ncbi:hypothetical protein IE53DRAFT_410247 [Violaceomyces palustris]|uniref:Uncharacterized protein n=1 Tax=Violaceomyces palustris TaxID=1673888 RepID=A0ACD0NZU6_9BASI|nr:hypothetical protein IE53DRAFT_410247 [Violaceomyces palustris]
MDPDLTLELQEATSDLLDLTSLPGRKHGQADPDQKRSSPRTPIRGNRTHIYSPDSKLTPIHSPSDIRPADYFPSPSEPRNDDGHLPTTQSEPRKGGPIRLNSAAHLEHDDHLPSAGLSSRIGSVKYAPSSRLSNQSIHPRTYDAWKDAQSSPSLAEGPTADRDTIRTESSVSSDLPQSFSRLSLALKAPVNDIYLNEYGERVVNGKVVGRLRSGRKRQGEGEDGASSNDSALARSSASLPLEEGGGKSAKGQSSYPESHGELIRTATPPAFFLQSFPDALTIQKLSRKGVEDEGKEEAITGSMRSVAISQGSVQVTSPVASPSPSVKAPLTLQAPRPMTRPLVLGEGSDILSDEEDQLGEDREARQGMDEEPSSTSADTAELGFEIRKINAARSSLAPSPLVKKSASRASTPCSRPPSSTGFPFEAVRAAASTQISPAQTEPMTLHGNKRQARRSAAAVAATTGSEPSPSGESTRDAGASPEVGYARNPPTEGKVAKLFKTQPIPSPPPTLDDDHTAKMGEQTFLTNSELDESFRTAGSWVSEEGGVEEEQQENDNRNSKLGPKGKGKDDDDDAASLESLPSSLLSLPVSTLTCSSSTPSAFSVGSTEEGSGMGLRRKGSGKRNGLSRKSSGRSGSSRGGLDKSSCFAREVRIRGWSEVGSQARGWVVFEIKIVTKQGTIINVFRRYSSFVQLRRQLSSECKVVCVMIIVEVTVDT